MRLALLTGLAAAALVAGAAGARAETIYITEPYVQTAPRYVYTVPTPIPSPGYVAIDPGYTVMAAPPAFALAPPPSPFFSPPPAQVVVAPPPAQVVVAPRPARVVVAPRTNRVAVAPARARIVVALALAPARVVVQAPEIV